MGRTPYGGGGYPPSQGFSFFVIGLDRKILNTPVLVPFPVLHTVPFIYNQHTHTAISAVFQINFTVFFDFRIVCVPWCVCYLFLCEHVVAENFTYTS